MDSLPQALIVELGSQTTLLIERVLRGLGVRSVILDPKRASDWLKKHPVRAIIGSGGQACINDKDAPRLPPEVFELMRTKHVPFCGICYGMQWLANEFGGEVTSVEGQRGYGSTDIELSGGASQLFQNTPRDQVVWMNHGDSVVELPPLFRTSAIASQGGGIAAIEHKTLPFYGVQFHPEVTHTTRGAQMLANFVFQIAGCERDWLPGDLVNEIQTRVRTEVGSGFAIMGFSGGVDSTTLARILAPVLGRQLRLVLIDGGHLRANEVEEIRRHAEAAGGVLDVIDARAQFGAVMALTTDAEAKRLLFKYVYTQVLVRAAEAFGAKFVIQGTLAPDRIESGATGGATIKSHHNLGLSMPGLTQLHPIDHLFKYEVRALAQELGLPKSVYAREPFPGPGLFIRVVGTPATPDKLKIVRWATARTRKILERHNLYESISQLVVAYLGVNTVGIKGDGRVYGGSIVVRPVETADFMTTKGRHLPPDVEDEIIAALTCHPMITRSFFDYTTKPPATTEME